jgi:hypothetical protein
MELQKLVVWYGVTAPDLVEIRVRTYLDGRAIEEATVPHPEQAVKDSALKAGRAVWDERDVADVVGAVWASDPTVAELVAGDPALKPLWPVEPPPVDVAEGQV